MAAEGPAPAIQVEGLSWAWLPGADPVLKDISFTVPPGARVLVVGQNGAGKSTVLELLAGLKMAPAKSVSVCGGDPFRSNSGNKVALIQGGWRTVGDCVGEGKAEVMPVWEMVGLPQPGTPAASLSADEPCEAELRRRKLHETLGLDRLLTRRCGSLSDGERRKVELARKLRDHRELILLDEATSDLDLTSRASVHRFLAEDAATVVNVTHVFDGMDRWATHVLHVHAGKVLRVEEVRAEELPPGGLFEKVAAWLAEVAGGAVYLPPPAVAGFRPDELMGRAVEVDKLMYAYAPWLPVSLCLPELTLPMGCRCILVGANGAGKSTLVSVIGGRRLLAEGGGTVKVLGHRAFHDHTVLDPVVAILSSEWKKQVAEISSGRSLSFQELANAAIQDLVAKGHDMAILAGRMVRLIQMLGIEPQKPLGTMSDGMMRRVQIALKLLRPSKLMLVDEVTADLDVLARKALLGFLQEESENGSAVVYCTHIMDGLDGWGTHVLRMKPHGHGGELRTIGDVLGDEKAPLVDVVLAMLQEDAKLPPPPAPAVPEPTQSRGGGARDEQLPSGWERREATTAGGYGSYVWRTDQGPEETWSFGSIAPAPSNALPPPPAPTQPLAPFAPFGGPGALGAPGAPGAFDAPASFGAPPGSVGGAYGGAAVTAPVAAAPARELRADDPCPSWWGARSNQLPVEELVARGLVAPDVPMSEQKR